MPLSLRQRIGLELQRSLAKAERQLHPLRTLFWECTLRCNLSCRHCGSDCKVKTDTPDMPAADFLKTIDSITPHVDPHQTFIIVSGGEPLMRDDLEEVGLALYRRGYPWGLVTNGMLLDRQRLERLLAAGLHSITVSLDGPEEAHNWLRCHPQSFARATEAIRLLAERSDLLWDVVSCVNPHSYPRLAETKALLQSLGVPSWRLFSIFPMGRASEDPDLQLTPTQFRHLLDFIKSCRSQTAGHPDQRPPIEVSYACEGFLGPYEQQVRDHFFYCRSGVDVASIRCDGTIGGCTSVRSHMDQGNIYTDDVWEVWQHRFRPMRDRSWTRKGQCASCKVYRYCEGSGLHLYDDDGQLLVCHYRKLVGDR